jgi:hypothetical protein
MTEVEWISLPLRTNATTTGPIIEYRVSSLLVKYDYQEIHGPIKWASLSFEDVLAYEVCLSVCCSAEDVLPSKVIQVQNKSDWRKEVVDRWQETVGWQQYHQNLGGEKRFKHYRIYFDDVCAVQLIAAACKVLDADHSDE